MAKPNGSASTTRQQDARESIPCRVGIHVRPTFAPAGKYVLTQTSGDYCAYLSAHETCTLYRARQPRQFSDVSTYLLPHDCPLNRPYALTAKPSPQVISHPTHRQGVSTYLHLLLAQVTKLKYVLTHTDTDNTWCTKAPSETICLITSTIATVSTYLPPAGVRSTGPYVLTASQVNPATLNMPTPKIYVSRFSARMQTADVNSAVSTPGKRTVNGKYVLTPKHTPLGAHVSALEISAQSRIRLTGRLSDVSTYLPIHNHRSAGKYVLTVPPCLQVTSKPATPCKYVLTMPSPPPGVDDQPGHRPPSPQSRPDKPQKKPPRISRGFLLSSPNQQIARPGHPSPDGRSASGARI